MFLFASTVYALLIVLRFASTSTIGTLLLENITSDTARSMTEETVDAIVNEMADIVISPVMGTVSIVNTTSSQSFRHDGNCSQIDRSILKEIHSYQATVDRIINYITKGAYKHKTFNSLATFVDTFGPRMSGTEALGNSIAWIVRKASEDGFDDVRTESVRVPHWKRNYESAIMVAPRMQKLHILGLGGSVATAPQGITAEVVVVRNWEELQEKKDKIPGKIVLYNQLYEGYRVSVQYRVHGASRAAALGAVAVLVRTVGDLSIASPHTGGQTYSVATSKIPAASVAVEDAKLISRLYEIGHTVVVNLTMTAENLPEAVSFNTIIDHRASEEGDPEDVVVISGHIDSWDVGTGAMDDAGGCFISYHANLALKRLGLRARRTIRTIWFTGEEQGVIGGKEYFKQHKNESEHYQLLLESDLGTFTPRGIGFSGSNNAMCIMKEILKLTKSINTTEVVESTNGPDIKIWSTIGVPFGSLLSDLSRYFWYHHSHGDTLDVEDPDTLDVITALWASVAYVSASLSVDLKSV